MYKMQKDGRGRGGGEEERVRLCDKELFGISSYISSNSNLKLWILMYVRFYFIESRTGKGYKNHPCTTNAIAACTYAA